MRLSKQFKQRAKLLILVFSFIFFICNEKIYSQEIKMLAQGFLNPPESARPGVYWYFMDGNISKEGMTADLESMKKAGIGNVVFLEVNVGVPRGPVVFLSEQWLELFKHAVRESERLGISIRLGLGPGWTGSGGPWVKPEQSMQHLVSSTLLVSGPGHKEIKTPLPLPKKPYFGEEGFTPDLKKQWDSFYEDVAVLAFPTPATNKKIEDIDEKALYYRAPYSSVKGVKQYLPSLSAYPVLAKDAIIEKNNILNLTNKLHTNGTLDWEIPAGSWTIMRFGRTNNGAVTRPAPIPGVGFESDKFDTAALDAHLDQYIGKILRKIGKLDTASSGGLKMLHMDSWEMGSQNWTPKFREEFIKRRGYDPLPFYPVYAGNIVESLEISERFLWDLRLTSQELVIEYHANHVKNYSHSLGLKLSIEPYDMNPTADLELGAVADIPMCEFWSKDFGYNTSFSAIEATSIAHVSGEPLVAAEAFTAEEKEGWLQHPGSMKEEGDWAFATGINRFVYHTFQHQPLDEKLKPGMTMGPYGVHWDRKQTWWPMVDSYHRYISRCQYILQQGKAVADILYLTPEGAPHIFLPPPSAMTDNAFIPDRKGYNFDGCSPSQLYKAAVKNNRIVFPGGVSYRLLVLPDFETMTIGLLEKVQSLIKDGAVVVGMPPKKSPGLSAYPACDQKIQQLSKGIWGSLEMPKTRMVRDYGKGKIIWGEDILNKKENWIYPAYELTASLLRGMDVKEDFESAIPVRYTHRASEDWDIYFVANRTGNQVQGDGIFRTDKGAPQLWNPVNGESRALPEFSVKEGRTTIALQLDGYESFFIIFSKNASIVKSGVKNFPAKTEMISLSGPWDVSFDTIWGGPAKVKFDKLADWTTRSEDGIKYYSGIAMYKKEFDLDIAEIKSNNDHIYLDLGEVKNMARVKLNGKDLGVVWTAPWKVDITQVVKNKANQLEIQVANLWPNRLIGDEQKPDDGIKDGKWPEWLLQGKERSSGRFTFASYRHYGKDEPLLKSGLIGPVSIHRITY